MRTGRYGEGPVAYLAGEDRWTADLLEALTFATRAEAERAALHAAARAPSRRWALRIHLVSSNVVPLRAARPEREDAMLVIEQRALEATRTPENSCAWLATCAIGGRRFEARSRRGAPAALARLLVAAAIPDQPVEVHALMLGRWYRPALRYRSLYALAAMTWEEGAATPLRRARYKPRQTSPLAVGAGTNMGGEASVPVPETPTAVSRVHGRSGAEKTDAPTASMPESAPWQAKSTTAAPAEAGAEAGFQWEAPL